MPNIIIAVPPVGIEIIGLNEVALEGQEFVISCMAYGSQPPARLEWFKNGAKIAYNNHSFKFKFSLNVSLLPIIPASTSI